MRESDMSSLCALLDDVAALFGQPPLMGKQKAMWFRALAAHDLHVVQAALDGHVKNPDRGRFMPKPADVIAQLCAIQAADGRPGPEEAWAESLRGADEDETIFFTEEMAAAWRIARPVFDSGDKVGARMAYREAYVRLVDAARSQGRAVVWSYSLGHDKDRRALALQRAVEEGRIERIEADAAGLSLLAPYPLIPPLALPNGATEGNLLSEAPPEVCERLRRLAANLRSADPGTADLLARQQTAEAKRRAAEQVARYRGHDVDGGD